MPGGDIPRLVELLGQMGKDDPKVQAMVTSVELNPENAGSVQRMLYNMVYREGGDPNNPGAFPIVKELPQEGVPLGPVDNGRSDGPTFFIPDGTPSNLQHTGIFGETRYGKSYILMQIALQTMLKGDPVWMFDVENEFARLIPAVPEPYKPITVATRHLRLNFFQPPGDWIGPGSWVQMVSLLLRGQVYLRDGTQNLFEDSLLRLLKTKGVFSGSNRFPSHVEILRYFEGLKLSGSEVRGKAWLESLVNRMKMLVNAFQETSRVTYSDMLQMLADKSVIFMFRGKRGIPLQFLTGFLTMWLSCYKEGN